MSVITTELQQAIKWLEAACDEGLHGVGTAGEATELFAQIDHARRLMDVVTVDAVGMVERSGSHRDHGHVNASVQYRAVTRRSSADSTRLHKIDRMLERCELLARAWRDAKLHLDQAGCLARAFANPRVRERFTTDDAQLWFLAKARRVSFKRFERAVARWVQLHDMDGAKPGADPAHERRNLTMVQDHFSTTWHQHGTFGSQQGALINQALAAYTDAEFAVDWAAAEAEYGTTNVSKDLLPRTDAQRRADAFAQIVADAINNPNRSAAVKTVHNIVWSAETYEEMFRRYLGGAARQFDPDTYRCETLDGEPLNPELAFADSLTAGWRRVVIDAQGVTVDMSQDQRFYTGLARLGVEITADECYWPGCNRPVTQCHIDHLLSASRGGLTTQINGEPGCPFHNREKERGYTVTRNADDTLTIACPNGDILQTEKAA